MTIINGESLLLLKPIKDMVPHKVREHGVSHGLSEVGYDLRLKQAVLFYPPDPGMLVELAALSAEERRDHQFRKILNRAFYGVTMVVQDDGSVLHRCGRVALASSIEEFDIPDNLWCEFRNKSTHARRAIDATIGTDAEPGWRGFLTIEILFHGTEPIHIPAGSGILKAVFHQLHHPARYAGSYQNQADRPVDAILTDGA